MTAEKRARRTDGYEKKGAALSSRFTPCEHFPPELLSWAAAAIPAVARAIRKSYSNRARALRLRPTVTLFLLIRSDETSR